MPCHLLTLSPNDVVIECLVILRAALLADRRTYVIFGIRNAAGGMHRSFASLPMTSALPLMTTFKLLDKSGGLLTDRSPPRCSRASLGGRILRLASGQAASATTQGLTGPGSPSPEGRSPSLQLEHRR